MCRTAPDKPIGGTCDRVKVQSVGRRETTGFPRPPRRKMKLCADRVDFNRFCGANAKDEQGGKFRVHRGVDGTGAEMSGCPARLFLTRAPEYCCRPRAIGQQAESGRSTAPAKPSMANFRTPSTKFGRGRLPAPHKGAADVIFWFGRSTANTLCVMRFRRASLHSHREAAKVGERTPAVIPAARA